MNSRFVFVSGLRPATIVGAVTAVQLDNGDGALLVDAYVSNEGDAISVEVYS
jgi:hypothetical protein